MSHTSVVERAPDGKYKDARFGFPESQKTDNRPARQSDFFGLLSAAVVRQALLVLDVRSIAAGVAVVAMAYLFWWAV